MSYKVLLVDDEYMILEGLKKLLPWDELGFEIVSTAKNGRLALDYVQSAQVDLVISDVAMPIKNGLSFVKEAYSLGQKFEVIILSGYQEFDYVRDALKFGTINYLLKPIDEKEMTDSLKKAFRRIQEKEKESQKKEILREAILLKWLHDECELEDVAHFFSIEIHQLQKRSFTCIIIKDCYKNEEIEQFIREEKQDLYFYWQDGQSWVLIFSHEGNELQCFLSAIKRHLSLSFDEMIIGETVTRLDEISLSFSNALSSKELHEFYFGESGNDSFFDDLSIRESIPEVSFIKFNQALSIRNFSTIREELSSLFQRIEQKNILPDYARHLGFLIFIDLYRNFDLSEAFYQKQAKKIIASKHFDEISLYVFQTINEIQEGTSNREYSPYIQQILQIIHEEYQHEITLKDISERLFINTMYAGQLFKKEVNKSFSQYLNHYRLSIAQKLLTDTEESISAIAVKTGYATANYLAKNFKKICGMSPKEYRKHYKT